MKVSFFGMACAAITTLSSCSTVDTRSVASGGRNPAAAAMCESLGTTSAPYSEAIPLCKKLYTGFPRVLLPDADSVNASGNRVIYGAFMIDIGNPNGWLLYDRKGRVWPLSDADGKKPILFGDADAFPSLPVLNRSYRFLFTVFRVEAEETHLSGVSGSSLHVVGLSPILWIDPSAVEGSLQGEWRGEVSARIPPAYRPPASRFTQKAFDPEHRVPLQIVFDSVTISKSGFSEARARGKVPATRVYRLKGRVTNWDELRQLGKANPFFGATSNEVFISRNLNMHGLLQDDHWVFDYPAGSQDLSTNGMSAGSIFMSSASLIAESASALSELQSDIVVFPHIPYRANGHQLRIHPWP